MASEATDSVGARDIDLNSASAAGGGGVGSLVKEEVGLDDDEGKGKDVDEVVRVVDGGFVHIKGDSNDEKLIRDSSEGTHRVYVSEVEDVGVLNYSDKRDVVSQIVNDGVVKGDDIAIDADAIGDVHVVEQETVKKRGRGRPPKSATRKSKGNDGGVDEKVMAKVDVCGGVGSGDAGDCGGSAADGNVIVEVEATPKTKGRGRPSKVSTKKIEDKGDVSGGVGSSDAGDCGGSAADGDVIVEVEATPKTKGRGRPLKVSNKKVKASGEESSRRKRGRPGGSASVDHGKENKKLEALERSELKVEPTYDENNGEGENEESSLAKKVRSRRMTADRAQHVSYSFAFQDENKDDFAVSDLVWGKVRSYPWWPGQIFDSSSASKLALGMQKDGQFLVAYFGDKTFAWCDESHLKPFQTCFPQMEKQNYMDSFRTAVDAAVEEVRRRVQLAMNCSFSDEAHVKMLNQKIDNAGIKEGTCANAGDGTWIIESFDPKEFLEYLHALAVVPSEIAGRLDLAIFNTQLNAFKRSLNDDDGSAAGKENSYLDVLGLSMKTSHSTGKKKSKAEAESGLSGKQKHITTDGRKQKKLSELNEDDGSPAGKENSDLDVPDPKTLHSTGKKSKTEVESRLSGKQKHVTTTDGRKQKKLSELMKDHSTHQHEAIEDNNLGGIASSRSSRQKRKTLDTDFVDSGRIKKKRSDSLGDTKPLKVKSDDQTPTKSSTTGKRRKMDHVEEPHFETENSRALNVLEEYALLNEVLSDLCLAAVEPLDEHSILFEIGHFFITFKKWLSSSSKEDMHVEVEVEIEASRHSRRKTSESQSTSTESAPKMSGYVQDSYWSDIILSDPDEDYVPEDEIRKGKSGTKQKKSKRKKAQEAGSVADSDPPPRSPGTKQELDAEKPMSTLQEVEECMPTELVLTFSDSYALPSVDDLVKIFGKYGPLREAETKVLENENIAKVVFKRRADAELASSGSGEHSAFGQASVGYRLRNLEPTLQSLPGKH